MKTYVAKKADITPTWYLVDAKDQVLGRVATGIARLLMGKHRPLYTPHVDSGDHVVVINVDGVKVTGDKYEGKLYRHHTFYPGGLRVHTYRQVVERFPTRPLELAVRRMLPKNNLQARRMRRLHLYAGAEHRHKSQSLTPVNLHG